MGQNNKLHKRPDKRLSRWIKRTAVSATICIIILMLALQINIYRQNQKVAERMDILTANVPKEWIKIRQYKHGSTFKGFGTAPLNHFVEYHADSSEQILRGILEKSGTTSHYCEQFPNSGSEIYCSGRMGLECALVSVSKISATKVTVSASSTEYCKSD